MEYEIDFLPVGEESKGGDAICFRYWDATTPQFVGIIDGGTADSGETLVNHIQKYYGTKRVDVVINTHPHADHTSGLYTVVETLDVQLLMMHKPWDHAVALKNVFQDGRITSMSIDERVRMLCSTPTTSMNWRRRSEYRSLNPLRRGTSPHRIFSF